MKHSFLFTLCLAGLTALTACSKDESEQAETTRTAQHYPSAVTVDGDFALTDAQQACVNRNNAFALSLLNAILQHGTAQGEASATRTSSQSIVFSPLSLTMALAFAADGASGTTQAEIWQTLGFDADTPARELCAAIMQNTLQADPTTRFNIANAFYLNSLKGFTMNADYVSRLHAYYDADIEALDFSQKASCDRINDWASRQTDGMIPTIVQQLDASLVACLFNAIFMEGKWQSPFDENATHDGRFTNSSGNVADVPLMHQSSDLPYYTTDTYQALRMDYGNGTYGMSVLLPREGQTIEDLLATLTPEALSDIVQHAATREVSLTLPRFTTETSTSLNDILEQMGLHAAFDPSRASFDGIVNGQTLFVSDVFQKARIEVSETKVRAAAVTGITLATAMAAPAIFNADHPFLYFITERHTGIIYFMGIYDGK